MIRWWWTGTPDTDKLTRWVYGADRPTRDIPDGMVDGITLDGVAVADGYLDHYLEAIELRRPKEKKRPVKNRGRK